MTTANAEEAAAADHSGLPPLPTPFSFDASYVSARALVETAAWERARRLPEWRSDKVDVASDPRQLLPADAATVLHHRRRNDGVLVAEGPDFLVCIGSADNETSLFVAACTAERAERVLSGIRARTAVPAPRDTVPFLLWRWRGGSASSWRRDLKVPAWADIAANYPARATIEAVLALPSLEGTGRLMLWTGVPGTGKTYAIRALARAWSPWCSIHVVVDAERFFGDAAYLLELLADDDGEAAEDAEPKATRLIICEDADDFIRARDKSGPGLGRLLNVADGLLGQGLSNVILLTSNTPVQRLDPALVRPGRLLANIEFARFTRDEARRWLGDPAADVPAEGLTLAELFERTGATGRHLSPRDLPEPVGAYL